MRYKDLPAPRPDSVTAHGFCIYAQQPMLRCMHCQEDYSACPGDYFLSDPDEEIICQDCGDPLLLVDKIIKYVEVR